MSLWKRGASYWMDATVNGQRYREPLNTTDWREARALERQRVIEIARRPPDPGNQRQSFGAMNIKAAIDKYAAERRAQVSPRMVAYWRENARPLAVFFDQTPLRKIDSGMIAAYQNARVDVGRAPKTVNGEVSVLRQVLRHAKLWYKCEDDYRTLKNTKPPVSRRSRIDNTNGLAARDAVSSFVRSLSSSMRVVPLKALGSGQGDESQGTALRPAPGG